MRQPSENRSRPPVTAIVTDVEAMEGIAAAFPQPSYPDWLEAEDRAREAAMRAMPSMAIGGPVRTINRPKAVA